MNSYMMGKRTEEKKYIIHNQDRFDCVFRLIDRPKRILDIGTSPFTFMLQKKYPKAQIWTLDYSDKLKKRCQKNRITFRKIDLTKDKLVFGKIKFDVITFLEVLEHLDCEHQNLINDIGKLLSSGGKFVLQTPNKFSPKALLVNFISESSWERISNTRAGRGEFKHFKEYSLKELTDLIRDIKSLTVLSSDHYLYFDSPKSALVYRKFPLLFTPLIYINYFLVTVIAPLRRGMMLVLTKTQLADIGKPKKG